MKLALVTYQDQGKYRAINVVNEDEQLTRFLTEKGHTVKNPIWNDPRVDWTFFDLILIKSPWDYFNHIEDFYNWLSMLEQEGCRVLNPLATLRWNADKHYLLDIAAAGLKVTPGVFTSPEQEILLEQYFDVFNTDGLIVKPAVSGGSKNTFKVTREEAGETGLQLQALSKKEDFIIQPFLKEIEENGEWSFLFFGGKFSHSLLKKAKAGDFRVQATFGGTVHALSPSAAQLDQVVPYADQFAKNCLYARIDGTFVNDEFVLMELELIEPFLFLETAAQSFENYYEALKHYLEQAG